MSCVHAKQHPIGFTISRLLVPLKDFVRCIAKQMWLLSYLFMFSEMIMAIILVSASKELRVPSFGR